MPLFTGIGVALGASSTVAAGATISAATAAGIGATALAAGATVAGMAATGAFSKPKSPSISMPQAPKIEDAAAKAQATSLNKRKAMSRSETVQTNPMGISGEAALAKKSLLGQ